MLRIFASHHTDFKTRHPRYFESHIENVCFQIFYNERKVFKDCIVLKIKDQINRMVPDLEIWA